jgi:hypothetical protein
MREFHRQTSGGRRGTIQTPESPFLREMTIHPFPLRAPHPMPVSSWQDQLVAAPTVADVVAIARDFLATFSPYELVQLPAVCRPPSKLYDGEDVTTYAFEVVRHDFEKEPERVAQLVHKLAAFFSQASIRLSEIQSRPDDQAEDSRRSA